MKKHYFKVGDLVINGGRLLGQGYIWRVEEVFECNPVDKTDRRRMLACRNIGPLHGKPERDDYHIGGCPVYLASEMLPFDGINKPAFQERLL